MQDDDEGHDCRILRGGAWYMGRPPQGGQDANCEQGGVRPQFGFRLAYGSLDRRYRGNRWFEGPNYAQMPHTDRGTPVLSGLYLGFRLVREDV